MANFDVKIENNNIDAVKEELELRIAQALETVGAQAENYTKLNLYPGHGFDTGLLRNSITHAVAMDEEAVYVGSNVEYSSYVELGTSKTKPVPFLKPAIEENMDEYREIVKKTLEGELDGERIS